MFRVLLLLLPMATASPSMALPSLAVLPLRSEGLRLNEANRLNQLLQTRAATSYELQDQELTTQLVEASQALGVDCDVNALGCGVELGKLADVQFVLLGQAVKLPALPDPSGALGGPTIGLDLQVVDVKQGVTTRRITGRVAIDSTQQAVDVDVAAAALFGDGAMPGLKLDVAPAGSNVKLDGIALGSTPLKGLGGLRPGNHVIAVSRDGFAPWTTSFSIRTGETLQLEVRLVANPTKDKVPAPPEVAQGDSVVAAAGPDLTLPFIGAGVGGLLALGGGVLVFVGSQSWFAFDKANSAAELAGAALSAKDPADVTKEETDAVEELNSDARAKADAWNQGGLAIAVGGGVGIALGSIAIGACLTWASALLEEKPEETAPTSASPAPAPAPPSP